MSSSRLAAALPPRKPRSQSLERERARSRSPAADQLPAASLYNISDPDMLASKLAEQEYLQSLGTGTTMFSTRLGWSTFHY